MSDYNFVYSKFNIQPMAKDIYEFRGLYRYLSNFYEWPITIDNLEYATVEHFYQAQKATDKELFEKIRTATTPGLAKRLGRNATLPSIWTDDVKLHIMEEGLRAKFAPNSLMLHQLQSTRPALLVEGNTWGDTFWGQVRINSKWVGENHLGKLLMRIRDE